MFGALRNCRQPFPSAIQTSLIGSRVDTLCHTSVVFVKTNPIQNIGLIDSRTCVRLPNSRLSLARLPCLGHPQIIKHQRGRDAAASPGCLPGCLPRQAAWKQCLLTLTAAGLQRLAGWLCKNMQMRQPGRLGYLIAISGGSVWRLESPQGRDTLSSRALAQTMTEIYERELESLLPVRSCQSKTIVVNY